MTLKGNRVFMNSEDFTCRPEEINRENRAALSLLARAGIPLGIANFAAQMVVFRPQHVLPYGLLLVAYFTVCLFVDRRVLPQNYPHATAALYLMQAPAMLLAVLLGTVWDSTHQATTILLMLLVLPVFIMDRPIRVMGFMGFWVVLFLAFCVPAKDGEILQIDAVHVGEFFVASAVITNVVLRVRIKYLENLGRTEYLLNHNRQTGCLSRYALEKHAPQLLNRPVTLLLADLDQLRMFRDFYGHETADAMMLCFAETMGEHFGKQNTFHYGADEILCAVTDGTEAECMQRMAACREKLHSFSFNGRKIPITCGLGCVTGTPESEARLHEMIQLADIYANKAKSVGRDQTQSGAFSQEALRQGIADSNLLTHAKAYEINQLTGLPSLSYFAARGDEMLTTVADPGQTPVIGCFKILHLREYNSEFGYARGDALIAETARRLRVSFQNRHICHITAGEFGILCYRDEAEQAVRDVAAQMAGCTPGFQVRCKAGFAPWREGQSTISLVDEAKIALNSILNQPERSICFYDSGLDEAVHFRQYILTHVDEAIEKGWLQVYYQPIARAATGEVCNEEALSRWVDPHYGFLTPDRFIPALEESGLMYKVNLNVVRRVLQDFDRRRELDVPVVPVSVNLSRRDFERCDMVEEITALVDASGYPRGMLKIEITESAFIAKQEMLRREIERFRSRGFEVWLDDFGSEYSTLNFLQEMDFDLVKLDMKFMENFAPDSKNFIIVSRLIDMAKQLGIATLIEGVETLEHYQIMRRLGCGRMQGFLFNKPNPFDYIVKRAQSGTGLVFEAADAAPYYEAVCRVDLNHPLQADGKPGQPLMDSEIPAGVLELRGGELCCLRGNEGFLRVLEGEGLLHDSPEGFRSRLRLEKLPEDLISVAESCGEDGSWEQFEFHVGRRRMITVFLRRLSVGSYRGGKALLAVLMPGREA